MTPFDNVVATAPGAQLTLITLLKKLHRRGQLRPLVFEILAEQVVREEAGRAGLAVSTEELQTAADTFRLGLGLTTTAGTHDWLASVGMSVDEFEAELEAPLLTGRLRQHLTATRVDEEFAARRAGLERLSLALVRVDREDLARELATQVRDEDRALDDVAGEQGFPVTRTELPRAELGEPLCGALAQARDGALVGPVATPDGFALVVIEQRRPAELDEATRQAIQESCFDRWLAERLGQARLNPDLPGAAG